jgi:hypothetical protein
VNADIDLAPELPEPVVPLPSRADIRPFPRRRDGACDDLEAWYVVAECAENYPKLLIWLAEGQVRGLRNVFGSWVAVLRLVPGLRWLLWHYVFEPIAGRAPWRPEKAGSTTTRRPCVISPAPAPPSASTHTSPPPSSTKHARACPDTRETPALPPQSSSVS